MIRCSVALDFILGISPLDLIQGPVVIGVFNFEVFGFECFASAFLEVGSDEFLNATSGFNEILFEPIEDGREVQRAGF